MNGVLREKGLEVNGRAAGLDTDFPGAAWYRLHQRTPRLIYLSMIIDTHL